MNGILQVISENGEWIFSGIGVVVLGMVFKKRKTGSIIVKNYNNINNKNEDKKLNSKSNTVNNKKTEITKSLNFEKRVSTIKSPPIKLEKLELYSAGVNGKVSTNTFYKDITRNFGVKVTLANNTYTLQQVRFNWRIYNNVDNIVVQKTFQKTISKQSQLMADFHVSRDEFSKFAIGKYKSQLWINGVRIQNTYFQVLRK